MRQSLRTMPTVSNHDNASTVAGNGDPVHPNTSINPRDSLQNFHFSTLHTGKLPELTTAAPLLVLKLPELSNQTSIIGVKLPFFRKYTGQNFQLFF